MFDDIKLKELDIFSIFKLSSFIFYKSFNYLFLITVFIYLPVGILKIFLPDKYTPIDSDFLLNASGSISSGQLQRLIGYSVFSSMLSILFFSLCIAGVTYIAFAHVNDEKVSLEGILESSIQKWGKIIVTALFYYFIWSTSAVFLIIPMFYFGIIFYFHTNIVAVTPLWGTKALSYSFKIVKGHFLSLCFFTIIIYIMESLISQFLFVPIYSEYSILNYILFLIFYILTNTLIIYFKVAVALKFINLKLIFDNKKEMVS